MFASPGTGENLAIPFFAPKGDKTRGLKRGRDELESRFFRQAEHDIHVLDGLPAAPFTMLSKADTATSVPVRVSTCREMSHRFVYLTALMSATLPSGSRRMRFVFVKVLVCLTDLLLGYARHNPCVAGREDPPVHRQQMGDKGDAHRFPRQVGEGLLDFRCVPVAATL